MSEPSPLPQDRTTPPIFVIGGGPAGSTCAMLLVEHGHRVVLLEKEHFPRFHIGESLLTFTQEYWDRLGLSEALHDQGFTLKKAGEARVGKHPDRPDFHHTRQHFWKVPNKVKPQRPWAYQVERARFDQWLLSRAKERGVEVHEGAKVQGITEQAGDVAPTITWCDDDGAVHVDNAAFIIDASGRHAVLARKLGHFVKEPNYMTSSVFGQFEGVEWPDDDGKGYINVYFLQDGWVWFIPLGDKTSVGVVMNEQRANKWPRDPQQVFDEAIGRFEYLRCRFSKDAKQIGPVRILRNLPYYAGKLTGPGWACCGDAAMFVDPIHSSGIHLAFSSGTKLADAVHEHLQGDGQALDRYAAVIKTHHERVRFNVSLYYRVVRFRPLIYWFVRGTGQLSNHWSGPILRRVNAWSFGQYHRFLWAMRIFWAMAYLGLSVFGLLYMITGRDRWGKHGWNAPVRPFSLPRVDASPDNNGQTIAEPKAGLEGNDEFHLEPGVGIEPEAAPMAPVVAPT